MSLAALLQRARPEIRALKPYASARGEAGRAEVLLNANENPWAPEGQEGINRYPEPQPAALVERLARLYGVRPEQVLVGRGSDEAIDLLTRAFCTAYRDAVLITPPTFGMYAVCAQVQGAAVKTVPLHGDFSLELPGVLAALADDGLKLIYFCTPGNPVGAALDPADIETVLAAAAGRALVVVDEAYGEFDEAASWCTRLAEFPNLAVLRTLSKYHGLAGARLGVLIAQQEIIALLRRIMAPYPLPAPVVELALNALSDAALARREAHREVLIAEREKLFCALSALPCCEQVFPSRANFLLMRCRDAGAVLATCAAAGILIRDRRGDVADCVRITVGTPEENRRLLEVLSRV